MQARKSLIAFENLLAETIELLISQGHRESDVLEYSVPKALFYRELAIKRLNNMWGGGKKKGK